MKKTFLLLIIIFWVLLSVTNLHAQIKNDAPVSHNAPTDQPHNFTDSSEVARYTEMIKPYVEKALKSLPKAKKRFLKGLPSGEAFFLTTRIYDHENHYEQIFVRVTSWEGDQIKGSIANDIGVVKGYKFGQIIEFPESAVLDWLITKPNGDEEGNFVGKYLDSLGR